MSAIGALSAQTHLTLGQRGAGPRNWEVLIKVLDGCATNGHTWVLGAATTNLGYVITVTDTVTGRTRSYENRLGRQARAIVDTEAFAEACAVTED